MHGLDGPAKAPSESQRSVHLPVAWAWPRTPEETAEPATCRPSIASMTAHLAPARRRHPLCLLVLGLALTACSPSGGPSNDEKAAGERSAGKNAGSCAPGKLATVTPARLTLSTGASTQAPWVVGSDEAARGGDPNAGQGYDAAVGFDLAERLGYARTEVTWTGTPFPEAIAAGDKRFDIHIGQATITDARRADIDLSEPYYVMRQAVVAVAVAGGPAVGVTSAQGLRGLRLALVKDSRSQEVLDAVVRPETTPASYDDIDKAAAALSAGEKDALVIDLQTALSLDRDETMLAGGELVGQLPRVGGPAESFGLVLSKGSSRTSCVNAALRSMRDDGTLDRLERRWLVDAPGFLELS